MATDFFERQDAARRRTAWLVLLFLVAVAAIVVSLDVLLTVAFGLLAEANRVDAGRGMPLDRLPIAPELVFRFDPAILALATFVTLMIVGGGSAYKVAQLWDGGHVVAEQLGGRQINPATTEPAERRLLNVVEEMAIASGTPTPPVYLLDLEDGINAFAAGHTVNDAVVGITQGSVQRLSRDELQGVIAHEFSHILHGDMRLNMRLMGVLHGILLIGLLGQFVYRTSFYAGAGRRQGRNATPVILLGLGVGLIALGFLGSLFGSLIKAAVSRQREFLADASAVQYTRNPGGLAGALKKIGGSFGRGRVYHPNAPEASHLFFGQAVSGLASVFATHPPLTQRIRRLDPTWDGRFVESTVTPRSQTGGRGRPEVSGLVAEGQWRSAVETVGQPRDVHLAYAAALLEHLPQDLMVAAREPFTARALIYALLIHRQPRAREQQLDYLGSRADPGVLTETTRLVMPVARLDPRARLPLVEMTVPALSLLTGPQYETFRANVLGLVTLDDRLELFEWTLQRILLRQLDVHHEVRRARAGTSTGSVSSVEPQCAVVLSTLAWVGHPTETSAARAFELGWAVLGRPARSLLSAEHCGFEPLDAALDDLDRASPSAKRALLEAASACIASDLTVTVNEAELLRAVAASLGCPMPPLVGAPEEALVAGAPEQTAALPSGVSRR